jgi:acetoin utilization deacetylase AcuC-like enzyme
MEPAVLYAPQYLLQWPGHVFPTEKYQRTFSAVQKEGLRPEDHSVPQRIAAQILHRVHPPAYLTEIDRLSKDPAAALRQYEIPISSEVIAAVEVHCQGTLLAVQEALRRGTALNIGGGFHHAFADRGEGFCFFNDIAVALAEALHHNWIGSAAVVDCDVHQGNGTASIFATDDRVHTYSIHQEDLYPVPKQTSTVDVGLWSGAGDDEYLTALQATLERFLDKYPADVLLYVAGADPFEEDQLGNLHLSHEGFRRRDQIVLAAARRHRLPVAAVLAGGYAPRVEDVVEIHVDLYRALRDYKGPS